MFTIDKQYCITFVKNVKMTKTQNNFLLVNLNIYKYHNILYIIIYYSIVYIIKI